LLSHLRAFSYCGPYTLPQLACPESVRVAFNSPPENVGPLYPVPVTLLISSGRCRQLSRRWHVPQLKCLGVVIRGPPQFAESGVVDAPCPVPWPNSDRARWHVMVRHGCGGAFLVIGPFLPRLYAFSAQAKNCGACSSGQSNFCHRPPAIPPIAGVAWTPPRPACASTFSWTPPSLLLGQRVSALAIHAFNPGQHNSLPRLPIVPAM